MREMDFTTDDSGKNEKTSFGLAKENLVREDVSVNPNSLHDFHRAKRGPRGVPAVVKALPNNETKKPKDPGHGFAKTSHISFEFFDQRQSNASFGYEHFISLPPEYNSDEAKRWPLIMSLHGSGESQRKTNESYASIRHGIPKLILCYNQFKSTPSDSNPHIEIPVAESLRSRQEKKKNQQIEDKSSSPVPSKVCCFLAENFITVSPSLNMKNGYGWSPAVLSALIDEVQSQYRVDLDRIHITGFSMGGYGTWELALAYPDKFASLLPICGGGDHLRVGAIKNISQWVHHGELDDIIPIQASIQMVDALEKAGALHVEFSRYSDQSHDSWTAAYNDISVYEWMLKCRRMIPEDPTDNADANESSRIL